MLDIGWQELLVIGALALIVVGPKELPGLLRSLGQWAGKLRRMAREFQRSMDDAAREADMANFKELRDLKNDIGGLDFKSQAKKAQSFLDGSAKPSDSKAAGSAAEAPADGGGSTGTDGDAAPQSAADAQPDAATEVHPRKAEDAKAPGA